MEEINNRKENAQEDELCSLSEILSSFCSEDNGKLNPLQEIFGAHSRPRPKDVIKKCEKRRDKKSNRTTKRQRSMEYRVMMEKVRKIFSSSSSSSFFQQKKIYIFICNSSSSDVRRKLTYVFGILNFAEETTTYKR